MPTKTDAPPLVDPALTPEAYEGAWIAKKKFTACFEGYPEVARDTPLVAEFYKFDREGTPRYLLRRNGRIVQTVTVKLLEELCKR